ncbi:hypothetical protein LCGC14_1421890 [marine sediment metagenome]|uniref:Nuclease associated modular domain-containing protein n=1 Tax=marine sediment metagenome TaxID=412755 RepID=A0A0F9JR00_9ZZZZ
MNQKMPKGIYIRTDKIKKILTDTHKEKIMSKETRKKISDANKGRKLTDEHRKNISVSHKRNQQKGKKHRNYGKRDKNTPNWKGNNACSTSIHHWVAIYKPKTDICEICHQRTDKNRITKLELSNIKNHKYTHNFDDYQ